MTLRRTFFMLLGAFAVLSAIAGLWQLADSRDKAAAAEWIDLTARLSDAAQRAGAQLAMERGLTAVMLARPADAGGRLQVELRQRRAAVDALHAQLTALADELARRAPEHPIVAALARVRQDRSQIERRRTELDAQLQGSAGAPDAAGQWVALTTRAIENLEGLITVGMLPLRDNLYTYASLPVIKDLLFTLAEHLGRERALLGVAIAQGVPLGEADQTLLWTHRVVATHARRRIEVIVEHLPASPALSRAREAFAQDLLLHYEAVRAGVYQNGVEGLAYPLSAEQWYREASRGIDAVTGLADAIAAQSARDIERLRQSARNTLGLLALIVVILTALFALAMRTLWRRVLEPLKVLEDAARRISDGDLAQPLAGGRDDEFGHLARTFEQMRQALLDDIARREADARLRSVLLDRSAAAIALFSSDREILHLNDRAQALFAKSNENLVGRKVSELDLHLSEAHYQALEQHYATLRNEGQVRFEHPLRDARGRVRWFDMQAALNEPGNPDSDVVWTLIDITDRREAEAVLAIERQRMKVLLLRFPGGVLLEDAAGVVVTANQSLCDLLALDVAAPSLKGLTHAELCRRLDETRAGWLHLPDRGHGREKRRIIEVSDGPERTLAIEWVPIVGGTEPMGRVWFFHDISERKQRETELTRLATTDTLTALPNRRSFMAGLEAAAADARRHPERSGGVLLMMDIDHFKRINDTWGHPVGDVVLQHVAQVIRSSLRQADIAGRLGGEEFGAVLYAIDLKDGEALAERLRATLADTPAPTAAGNIDVRISIGVAPLTGDDTSQILSYADKALYAAKAAGRNRVWVWSTSHENKLASPVV
ncbi:sensor domain-containing diguanylate cyclase [Aromatoleum bremense]|uniref:Diguanylate cyclase n=1 Tax=Aromatoleum bremense TaxID=76115 RepID=A0ABX1NVI1_9RHOO|nr:diguanylate cyclase [Aromatoleum bremense]NMG15908.1 diguanylate cyclase [Aromatoleum bremense]QTQ32462.1 Diguanylate cyclase/phosphodiesterase, PAS domain-containing [Aromatoleum bremense]